MSPPASSDYHGATDGRLPCIHVDWADAADARVRPGGVRRGGRPGPIGTLGPAALRPRHDAVVHERARPGRHRRPARLAGQPGPLHDPDRGSRGVRGGGPRRRVHDGGRRRDGRQQPRAGDPPRRLRHGRRLARPARPGLDRPGCGRRHGRRPGPACDALDRRQQVRHDDRAARVSLGLAIGTLAKSGRDKLTFLADPAIASFGSWVEQLIAESTGKHGTGIVPIDREPIGDVRAYGDDRVFVRLGLADGAGWSVGDGFAEAATAAGHPVVRIELADPIDLGAEALRWEVATAIAGAVLGIDPFDQPNVEEAKELTRRVLAAASAGERRSAPRATLVSDAESGITLHGDAPPRLTAGDGKIVGELARHLARRKPNAYLAL